MGSSAQNSSGVHWCRRRVRFNEVPEVAEKVPEKVPEVGEALVPEVGEALVQSQVRFNRVPKKVPEKVWEALMQSQVKFNRIPKKVPEVGQALVQSQVRFNRVPKKVLEKVPGGLVRFNRVWKSLRRRSVQPGQVQQGSGEGSSAWLGSTLQKVKRCGCWGYHRS